jgi:COP9 signalosome complex subunit 6
MDKPSENPLISSKPSDSGITVSLHPLVLLTASDQITRHRVREEAGPIAGILLGQHNGREITAEHAFAAGFDKDVQSGKLAFKQPWLNERVQQRKSHLEFLGKSKADVR